MAERILGVEFRSLMAEGHWMRVDPSREVPFAVNRVGMGRSAVKKIDG
jgi:hypothetical protein